MNIESTDSWKKGFGVRTKHFCLYFLVLAVLVLPGSLYAAYFPGPSDVLSSLQFNSQNLGSQEFSQEHLIPIDPSSGELVPPRERIQRQEIYRSEVIQEELKADPYSDAAFEEEDPFGDDPFGDGPGDESDLEEDPFADEEQEVAHMSDPFERWYNRPVYVFNDHFYEYFMRPVAQTYKDVVAENFRIMIRESLRHGDFSRQVGQ